MRKDLIEIKQMGGLKCDNPNCDYVNEFVPASDYKNWVNCPCPKCGANLLTQEDYKSHKKLLSMINVINRIGRLLPERILKELEKESTQTARASWNGSGKMKLTIEEENK